MESYISHLQWMHSAFLDNPEYENRVRRPRYLVRALDPDPFVLIQSYRSGPTRFSVGAVSPVGRLLSEILGGPPNSNIRVSLHDSGVFHEVDYHGSDERECLQPIAHIEWWLRKCHLPILLRGSAAAERSLSASRAAQRLQWLIQPATLRECCLAANALVVLARLELSGQAACTIHVAPSEFKKLTELTVSDCIGQALPFLAGLPVLKSLTMDSNNRLEFSNRNQAVGQPLTVVRGIEELDMSTFRSAATLVELRITGNAFRTLDGFHFCTSLISLNLSHCGSLASLAALAFSPALRMIDASYSGIHDVDGLSSCPNLEFLRVDHCLALRNVSALAGAPLLKTVDAAYSGLANIEGLGACARLEVLDIRDCSSFTDLTPLIRSRRLREIRIGNLKYEDLECPSTLLHKLVPPVKVGVTRRD